MRILVTGGAGFIGSHLIERLMNEQHEVICLDNFYTGTKSNVSKWYGHPNFEFIRHDITEPIRLEVDRIYHLACPASPVHYQANPIKTTKVSFLGTSNMLGLAKRVKARGFCWLPLRKYMEIQMCIRSQKNIMAMSIRSGSDLAMTKVSGLPKLSVLTTTARTMSKFA